MCDDTSDTSDKLLERLEERRKWKKEHKMQTLFKVTLPRILSHMFNRLTGIPYSISEYRMKAKKGYNSYDLYDFDYYLLDLLHDALPEWHRRTSEVIEIDDDLAYKITQIVEDIDNYQKSADSCSSGEEDKKTDMLLHRIMCNLESILERMWY